MWAAVLPYEPHVFRDEKMGEIAEGRLRVELVRRRKQAARQREREREREGERERERERGRERER